ncbi:MAG: hypothetical protein ICV79_22565 [Flavisolibacter sp.]|nr:hypothetical protein [Flavisolibacter sp.]
MKQLTEKLFQGIWRSYKVFQRTGDVKLHSKELYQEFNFNTERWLSITSYHNKNAESRAHTNDWNITFKDKRHYLNVEGKYLKYEVITINHIALVLMDTSTNEKFFFARPQTWENYIDTQKSLTL